jgi:hypothetical protein
MSFKKEVAQNLDLEGSMGRGGVGHHVLGYVFGGGGKVLQEEGRIYAEELRV